MDRLDNAGRPSDSPRIYMRLGQQQALYFHSRPALAGGKRGHYAFERRMVAAGDLPAHSFDNHMFLLPMSREAVPFRSRLNGRQVNGLLEPWRFRFLASGDSLATAWDGSVNSILCGLDPTLLARAAGHDRPVELRSRIMPHSDPVLLYLTLGLQSFLQSGAASGSLFEQSLLTTIAAHLVYRYGSRAAAAAMEAKPLVRWKRRKVEEYVRENLASDLSLTEIAQVACLSPQQLSRTFRAATGMSLWQYVLASRVERAQEMLGHDPTASLSHIAAECGFQSYSPFVCAFRKFTGHTPSTFRRLLLS